MTSTIDPDRRVVFEDVPLTAWERLCCYGRGLRQALTTKPPTKATIPRMIGRDDPRFEGACMLVEEWTDVIKLDGEFTL